MASDAFHNPALLDKESTAASPFPGKDTIELWALVRETLLASLLLGMDHAAEGLNIGISIEEFKDDWTKAVPPLRFEEAVTFLSARVPLTKEEFETLEPQLRFRAFTIARLTELDAIGKVKGLLVDALDQGWSLSKFWQEVGREGLLGKAGFAPGDPWYWETVFRTNLQSSYNAGRLIQMSKDPGIEYYEFVGIRDSRQTDMCRRRTGVIRPVSDPWWQANWPPLHHNCYSDDTSVLTVEKGWVPFSELTGDETFFSLNPDTGEIETVKAIRKIAYHYSGKMVELKSRSGNMSLLVTPDHNMAYISSWDAKKTTRRIRMRPASELADSDLIPRTGKWKGDDAVDIIIGKHRFDAMRFMAFMGWYLSDGSISLNGKQRKRWVLKITQVTEDEKREEILKLSSELFKETGSKIYLCKEGVLIHGMDPDIWRYFKTLGHAHEKYVPPELKELSARHLRALLDAFVKCDGHEYDTKYINATKGGKWDANFRPFRVYVTSSKRLRDDLSEIILKCGKLPSLYAKRGEGKTVQFRNGAYTIKHGVYGIGECWSQHFVVRKNGQGRNYYQERYYDGMVYCVELERNHILYVMRNGRCCWSGNCRSAIRPVYREEMESLGLRVTRPNKLDGLPAPSEGFGLDPMAYGSFWRLPQSMVERAKRCGIFDEVTRLAASLGLEAVEMPNPGTKFYPKELVERLGINRKVSMKQDDLVPKWDGSEELTPVKALLKDLLNNEKWITQFTHESHILKHLKRKRIPLHIGELSEIKKFLKNPERIYRDRIDGAFLYARKVENEWFALVVGEDSGKIFTIMRIKATLAKKRYELLFEE